MNTTDNVDKSLAYKDGYVKKFVEEPFARGYYIEAFSRMDSLLDSLIFEILDTQFEFTDYNLLYQMFNKSALIPSRIAQVFKDVEFIDAKTFDSIETFKKYRNILVHRTDGQFEILLKESGFYKQKHVCRNCIPNINEHLKKIGEQHIAQYSVQILRQKLDVGLFAYNKLKQLLKLKSEEES